MPEDATVDIEEAEAALAAAEAALERDDREEASAWRDTRGAHRRRAARRPERALDRRAARGVDELSLRALEIEARAALDAGRPPAAERAARRLVERAPYRESAYELLLEALAKRGNLAEATLVYDRLRTLLRDELGTAPSPAVVALHDRLLAGDAAVATAPGRPPFPSVLARAAERPFMARARSSTAAGRVGGGALRRGTSRRSPVNPGSARRARRARRTRGARQGGHGPARPLSPGGARPVRAVRRALRQLPAAALGARRRPCARGAGARRPQTGRRRRVGAPPPVRCGGAHAGRCARAGPLVLVLEDLHWAEPATLLLTRHVARALSRRPDDRAHLRTTEAPGTGQVVRALSDLEREVETDRVGLRARRRRRGGHGRSTPGAPGRPPSAQPCAATPRGTRCSSRSWSATSKSEALVERDGGPELARRTSGSACPRRRRISWRHGSPRSIGGAVCCVSLR